MDKRKLRNLVAFWLLGLCTDFAYIVMLSGAEDIINQHEHNNSTALGYCEEKLTSRHCASLSTGAVLLADILPVLFLKGTIPFYMEKIPIDIRHIIVVLFEFVAFIVVAFALNITTALTGVVLASFSCGLGEVSYISFTSFFDRSAVSTWSSGTGGASIFGSLAYAGLTEPHFANLTPKTTLLILLCIPVILALTIPKSIYRIKLYDPRTWVVPQWYLDGELEGKKAIEYKPEHCEKEDDLPPNMDVWATEKKEAPAKCHQSQRQLSFIDRLRLTLPLLRFMIPLTTVYFAEYLINQGLVELIIFDCSHGFHLGQTSQYRWYQVIYQVGVFVSRSTSGFYTMPRWLLYTLPVLQLANAVFFFFNAMYFFIPHIGILFALIFLEGLIGGSSYVNTFKQIYSHVKPDVREFSLSVASISDTIGVVVAGFLAIPIHNFICGRALP